MGSRGRKSSAELAIIRPQPGPDPAPRGVVRPVPPAHLAEPTKRWWRETVTEFGMEAHHVRLLTLAAQAWDRGEQAREALARHGLTFEDEKGMVRARPEIAIERDSRIG